MRWASEIPIPLTLLLAALLRLACTAVPGIMLRDDASYYVYAAQGLARGDGYLLRGAATAYWPVGYPAFLSLFMHSPWAGLWLARGAQCGLSVACVTMSYWISRRVWGEERPARLTASILAFMPNEIMYPSLMLSDVLFTSVVLAGCVALLRSPRASSTALGGVCFGAAALVRPVAALLPALIVLLDRSGPVGRRIMRATFVTAVMVGVTLPWSARNYRVFHQPVWISTNGGVNAWMGNHVDATGGYRFTSEMALAARRLGNEAVFDRYAGERALDFVRDHPGRAIGLAVRKIGLMWAADHNAGDTVFPRTRSWQRKVSAIATDVYYVLPWALVALVLLRRRHAPWLPLAALVYFTGVYAVTVALPRYQFPALPWLAMVAAGIVATPRVKQTASLSG